MDQVCPSTALAWCNISVDMIVHTLTLMVPVAISVGYTSHSVDWKSRSHVHVRCANSREGEGRLHGVFVGVTEVRVVAHVVAVIIGAIRSIIQLALGKRMIVDATAGRWVIVGFVVKPVNVAAIRSCDLLESLVLGFLEVEENFGGDEAVRASLMGDPNSVYAQLVAYTTQTANI